MASFKAECVGGPQDGVVVDLEVAPRDGDVLAVYGREYVFNLARMRWVYVYVKPQQAVEKRRPKR